MKWYIVIVLLTFLQTIVAGVAPPGSCPVACVCKWKGGKQTVECMDRGLITIPEPVDPATQVLDMSGNNLQILPHEVFGKSGLVNLQRVYLRSCNIGQINEMAFKGLTNLVELDLSYNLLTQIPSNSFKDTPFLRDLTLSYNPILKIHSDALLNLKSIVKLDFSSCDIRDIASDVFNNLNSLESLKLNGNNLRELPLSSLERTKKLRVIDLSDNPWSCDCRLRDLKMWISKHNFFSSPSCTQPIRLENKQFSELSLDDFACKPEIVPINRNVEAVVGENATVACRVEAVPSANINWYWNGRLLQNGTNFNSYQKIYIYEIGESKKMSTLTLTNTQETGLIELYCVAENKGGSTEANFTLHVIQMAGMASLGSAQIASLGAALFLIVILVALGLLVTFVRFRQTTACESKTPNTLDRVVSGNEVHPTATNRPHVAVLANRQEIPNYADAKSNQVGKPPRSNDISYTTNHYEGRGSIVTAAAPIVASPTASGGINPDLINDTRPDSVNRPGSGEYAREGSDSLYPSGLWDQIKMNQANNLARAISSAIPTFYNDRTPIIENSSVNGSHEELGYTSRTFPRSHVMTAANIGQTNLDTQYPADYGLPVSGARTLRVWQRAPPVLPPVSALKRVLTITRPSEDGFQDGCVTDV